MRFRKVPDWLIYGGVVLSLLVLAIARQERTVAPPAVPRRSQPSQAESDLLGPATPFDPAVVVDAADPKGPSEGTAFSVADTGVWLTARHVVDGCTHAAIVIGEAKGVEVQVHIDPRSEAAVLTTEGGTPALPLGLTAGLRRGERAFHPGFPQGKPGEVATRLLGRETLVVHGRGARNEPVLVWAEAGRSVGLTGSLGGLSGSPALDGLGRVVGVTVAEAPRRGRVYTTSPESVTGALAVTGERLAPVTAGEAITPDNYGHVADDLRRTLRVAQVICLSTT